MKKLPVGPAEIAVLVSLTRSWTRADVETALVEAGWATKGEELEWSAGPGSPHFFGGDDNGWRLELGDPPTTDEPSSLRLPCALFWPALDMDEDLDDEDDFDGPDEVDDLDDEYALVWARDPEADRDAFDQEFERLSDLLRAELGEPDKRTEGMEPEETWLREGLEVRLEMTDDINSYSNYDLIAVEIRRP